MSNICEICGKSPSFGNKISHSHRKSRRRWNPNIQTVHAIVNGKTKKMNVCAKCIKANKVIFAPTKSKS